MAVDRPTFSESWYRVAALRPRLRSTVQVYRQHFRGQMWHVLQDPAANQFFRLNEPAYRFVALLDGQRPVADVWRICNEQLGDSAPTQGEAIQLLGQLYGSNLIQAELPPDTEGLFRRFQKRRTREVQGYLTNLLFVRIPLFDPNRFLNRFVGLFGKAFTWYGFVIWLILIAAGLYAVINSPYDLAAPAKNILDPASLPLLYVSFVLIKVFHEFGHGFACKKFGRQAGGGEVHVLGVMLLVFTPMPYVDASSAWAFRSKWHRAFVGAAGMYIELAVAAVAAMIWAGTDPTSTVHVICFNVMFIASVSSLVFNGNPLLRYDGYYILSDLLEIPNLAQRSKDHIYYLVKRYVWGVRQARPVAHSTGEKVWFIFYGVASTIYRVLILTAILLFISEKLFFLGVLLAVGAVIAWVGVPVLKFLRYLATDGELMRVRGRAVMSTVLFLAGVVGAVGLIPMPDRHRVEGVIEASRMSAVYARADGFVEGYLPTGRTVSPDGEPVLVCRNPELDALHDQILARQRELTIRQDLERQRLNPTAPKAIGEQLRALETQKQWIEQQQAGLSLKAPLAGTWMSMRVDHLAGAYVNKGDPVGVVASLNDLVISAPVSQQQTAVLAEAYATAEVRLKGRPELKFSAEIVYIPPAGQYELPTPALGFGGGGSIATAADDRQGIKAAEQVFQVRLKPDRPYVVAEDGQAHVPLLLNQRVIVRFELPPKPLIQQWWRSLLQLIQRRGGS